MADLEAEQEGLSKKINKKVMSMFEKAEQEYQDLVQRKTIIENDKSKIEKVIAELDEKKNETLKKTWLKVWLTLLAVLALTAVRDAMGIHSGPYEC